MGTPLEYAHADGGKHCFTKHAAGPYDGFKAAHAYDVAVFDDTKEEPND